MHILKPFDPRDHAVLPVALPVTDQSVLSAMAANEADRRRYVMDVARSGPQHGLRAILDHFSPDQHWDVLIALTQFVDLEIDHGSATCARVLMAYRLEMRL